ncbi:hypothetical protein ZTR_03526 [Talaromyces verruculosus]|nr:hypothetical protein ZTR_03526 [Talaromyces verruculosus]
MSRASSDASGSFAESVKDKNKKLADNRCWACLDDTLQPQSCHVIAKEDPVIENWERKGLLTFDLRKECNSIALCTSCHAKLDQAADPGLIFFPEDLEFFIQNAKQDAENPHLPRQIPTADEYRRNQLDKGKIVDESIGGLYRCFDLKPKRNPLLSGDRELQQRVLEMEQAGIQKPKPWHGAPIASLRRAIAALGSNRIDEIVPEEQIQQLTQLRILYNKPRQHTNIASQDGDENSSQGDQSEVSESTASTKKRKRSERDIEPRDGKKPRTSYGLRPRKKKNQYQEEDVYPETRTMAAYWTFGPNMSSQDIIDSLTA